MKRILVLLTALSCTLGASCQEFEGNELGVDGYFGASTFGGSFGLGLKYGFNYGENLIVGPSLRFQRSWNNNINGGPSNAFNTFGFGGFGHARFFNTFFVGAELEMMRTPLNSFGAISSQYSWAPTALLGGGFSREFNESIRINAGVYYDVINDSRSPFRQGYFMKRANGTYIPVIYRIAFFFPL